MIKLNKLFKRKKYKVMDIYYLVIDYSDDAYNYKIGHWSVKKIYHVKNGVIVDEEQYDPIKIKMYKRYKIPIFDMTRDRWIPVEFTRNSYVIKSIFGRISL